MKIKSLFFLSALFVGSVCCLTSCDDGSGDGSGDGSTGDESIYWNKSMAFQMQLKGNVKTLVLDDSMEVYTFNQTGNVDSYVYENQLYLYTYINGRLTRLVRTTKSGMMQDSYNDTTLFTYGSLGKYVPVYLDGMEGEVLFKNLASVKRSYNTVNYVLKGDSVLMLTNHTYNVASKRNIMGYVDTTRLIYNGGSFPLIMKSRHGLINLTYASDGRFITFNNVGEYFTSMTTYKPNSDYLLPLSDVTGYQGQTPETYNYTYDEKDEVIAIDGTDKDEEYSDYVYDNKNNWISRKYRYTYDGTIWSEKETETRLITYWE